MTKRELIDKINVEDDNMTVDCKWSRSDLKRYLYEKRKTPNIIFLVLGSCFFFYITYYGWVQDEFVDKKILLLGFAIYFIVLLAFLWLVTKIYVFVKLRRNDIKTSKAYGEYHIQADDSKIVSVVGDEEITYDWKDVSCCKFKKNYFFLATKKDKLGLCFRREVLKNDYDKLFSYVKAQL